MQSKRLIAGLEIIRLIGVPTPSGALVLMKMLAGSFFGWAWRAVWTCLRSRVGFCCQFDLPVVSSVVDVPSCGVLVRCLSHRCAGFVV